MAKKSKTAQFAIVKGVLEEEQKCDDGQDADEYQKEIRAHMDARKEFTEPDGSTRPATADDWTLDLNKIEDELKRVRAEEHSLNAQKEAIHRLIGQWLGSQNLTSATLNGYRYSETFKPVAKVVDKVALVDHCLEKDLKALLSVHSGTLNSWVSEAILQAIEQSINNPEELPAELQALGIEPGDNRGKENLGTEGGREAFLRLLETVIPPGVVANARTALSRQKA
jgi:hypothetical protein